MAAADKLSIQQEVSRLYQAHAGALLASLLSYFKLSQMEMAEDVVQDTFEAAWLDWSKKGLPDHPKAWLFKVCKNKALKAMQRKSYQDRRYGSTPPERGGAAALDRAFLPHEIADTQLRLLFATCHPDLSPKARIMLTLKTQAGFKTEEIAKGLGMQAEAVKRQLSRCRAFLRERNIPLKVPFLLQSQPRLNSVHQVLYLLFNEGYYASGGEVGIRKELCWEALRLTRTLLDTPKIARGDTYALFALMLFHSARMEARLGANGIMIDLENQDRKLWDRALIQSGIHFFNQAEASAGWSRYHGEAAIASLHCTSASFAKTPWASILKIYDRLLELEDSPFTRFNRCIALFYGGEPEKAVQELRQLAPGPDPVLYEASLAKLYGVMGQKERSREHYRRAMAYAFSPFERRAIREKLEKLGGGAL